MPIRLFLLPLASIVLGEHIGARIWHDHLIGLAVGTLIGYVLFMIVYLDFSKRRYKAAGAAPSVIEGRIGWLLVAVGAVLLISKMLRWP